MRSADIVRKLILDAAGKRFSQLGFRKTSIDDIARTARIGKGSVYLHFPSKEAIFADIIQQESDHAFEELRRVVTVATSGKEAIKAFVTTKLTVVAQSAAKYQLAKEVVDELMPKIAELRAKHVAREHALLVSIIRKGVMDGDLVVKDVEKVAAGLNLCLDAIERSILERDPHGLSTGSGISEVLEIFLKGLEARR
jgi:AcrR family transcriptional regulator